MDALLESNQWHGQIYSGGWVSAHGGDMPITEPATGAELARAGLVDGVDVAVIPVLIGSGLPLYPSDGGARLPLVLRSHRLYTATGTLFLEYDVRSDRGTA